MSSEKKSFRTEMLSRAKNLSNDYKFSAGKEIQQLVKSLPAFREAKFIFTYVSVENEPNTYSIIASALNKGKRVCVPKCYGDGKMELREITSLSDLKPGFYNIPEPKDSCPYVRPDQPDFCIIPCISCSHSGHRIGHGVGYYDRFLQNVSAPCATLCFEEMTSDDIPLEPHDITMNMVITENGVFDAK